jgi:hypothetical protein
MGPKHDSADGPVPESIVVGTTGMYRPPVPSDARLVTAAHAVRRIKTSKRDVTWLQGPGPTDLFTWIEENGAIKEQELTFFGRTILARGESMTTGLCDEGGRGAYQGKTGLITFDTKLDGDTLAAAYIILDALPDATKSDHVEHLKTQIAHALETLGRATPTPVLKDVTTS